MGIAIGLISLWLMTHHNTAYLRIMFSLGLAILIVGFTAHEQYRVVRWPSLLLLLGSSSYSIYLIHNPLLSVTQRVAGRLGFTWPAAMVFGIVLSVLLGWIYYLVVERPVQRRFKIYFKTR
jgi:peptidoglycan/LPS O-acetylase OafA/YrhL